jgi:single-strand DNA-binding protein
MSASLNKVILIGNLGKDPELKSTSGGKEVATFSIATTEKWTSNGQKQEKTEWHNIVVWGKLAGLCAKYLAKGRPVYIEGKITTRSWDSDDGTKHYKTEIVVDTVKFLGASDGKRGSEGDGNDYDQTPSGDGW